MPTDTKSVPVSMLNISARLISLHCLNILRLLDENDKARIEKELDMLQEVAQELRNIAAR